MENKNELSSIKNLLTLILNQKDEYFNVDIMCDILKRTPKEFLTKNQKWGNLTDCVNFFGFTSFYGALLLLESDIIFYDDEQKEKKINDILKIKKVLFDIDESLVVHPKYYFLLKDSGYYPNYNKFCNLDESFDKNRFKLYWEKNIKNETVKIENLENIRKTDKFKDLFSGGLETIMSLQNPNSLRILLDNEDEIFFDDFKVNSLNINKFMLFYDAIHKESNFYYGNDAYGNNNIIEMYCDKVGGFFLNQKEQIIKNNLLTLDVVDKYIFESRFMKTLLTHVAPSKFDFLFGEESLNLIIKKTSSNKSLKENFGMLNNLLGLAPIENWVKAISEKNGEFKLTKFFKDRICLIGNFEYSESKWFNSSEDRSVSWQSMPILIELFDVLIPEIKKYKIDSLDLDIFLLGILKINNKDLIVSVFKNFDMYIREDINTNLNVNEFESNKKYQAKLEYLNTHKIIIKELNNHLTNSALSPTTLGFKDNNGKKEKLSWLDYYNFVIMKEKLAINLEKNLENKDVKIRKVKI